MEEYSPIRPPKCTPTFWKFVLENDLVDIVDKLLDEGYTNENVVRTMTKQEVEPLDLKKGQVNKLLLL